MKKHITKKFINEIHCKSLRKNYETSKTMIKSLDDTCSSDFLDMIDYSPKNKRGYRLILVVYDNFSEFVWTIPLKNKYAQ